MKEDQLFKYKLLWIVILLAYINPAYLERFTIFDYYTAFVKFSLFAYFVFFKLLRKKIPNKIILWIGYAFFPTIVTFINGGDIKSALTFAFIVINISFIFFYLSKQHIKAMIEGLALLMEVLVVTNFITIIMVPNGLYLYTTDAGWKSSEVWFFGLRNSHSHFLCLACFASVVDYYITQRKLKKILTIMVHAIAIATVFKLSSGGGVVAFTLYMLMLFILMRRKTHNFILKIRLVVLIHIVIFLFLSFCIANTNVAELFSVLGEQRVYTLGRRIEIWTVVWEQIRQAPLFGYGFMSAEDLRWLSNLAAGAISSHNSMIDICFRGGFVTLVVYYYMLKSAGEKIDNSRNINYRIKNYIAVSWFTILLLLQTEGSMMSIPLLVIVGITLTIGKISQSWKQQQKTPLND